MNAPNASASEAIAFTQYAQWYNAFNRNKDYSAEARYILERVSPWQPTPKSWLDVGCGTGEHLSFLLSRGLVAEGVDASPEMIAQARISHPNIPFHIATAQNFRLDRGYDVISMLFHVLSYQTSDSDVTQALHNAAEHLDAGGILVFDFWHSGGVWHDSPGVRVCMTRVVGRRLFRIARPAQDPNHRRVDVHYEFRWDTPHGDMAFEEVHSMRHFTGEELVSFLDGAGLEVMRCEGWLSKKTLCHEDWYGLICARKHDEA